ncbi:hypothetical protein NIES4071_22320 [Calothrix sp. NIES-4071]|nr:hypothetical protein NIES4071_22320 [Calothrix sp. NIES-4071]BAZ56564.1 hypothetical protein NIES4105_22270 [Calothrix sp. NIES-4105]
MTQQPDDEVNKQALIAELTELGIKHTPEKIICIARLPNGKIVFLEEGKTGRRGSGLAHILEQHKEDFARRGISEDEIPAYLMAAVTTGTFMGYQGMVQPRYVYEVIFNGRRQYIAVSVSDNGYIVGANPTSLT